MKDLISEKTPVTIGLVIAMLGGVIWLSTLYAKTVETSTELSRIESKQDQYDRDIKEISNHLSLIEGKLGIYPKDD